MSAGISVDIRDTALPVTRNIISRLSDRPRMNRFIGRRVQSEVRDYLIGLAATRHDTANRLGAQPTGFLAEAAEKVSMPKNLYADSNEARIALTHPGMARAFRDVTIVPQNVSFLTIAIAPESYGHRILKGKNSRFPNGFFFTSKKGNRLFGERVETGEHGPRGGKRYAIHLLYLLLESVTQKQDRTLLPSDEEIKAAALEGAADFVQEIIDRRTGRSN